MTRTAPVLLLIVLAGVPRPRAAAAATEDPLECVPNGSFEQVAKDGKIERWAGEKQLTFEADGADRVLRVDAGRGGQKLEWDCPDRIVWGGEYVLSFRVRSDVTAGAGQGMRLCLWPRLPDRHEPPNGSIYTDTWRGQGDWRRIEKRFRMPAGVTRFALFVEDKVGAATGTSWIDDVSIRPANARPLALDRDGPSFGDDAREQLAWVWTDGTFRGGSSKMGKDLNARAAKSAASFRRTIDVPAGATDVKAVWTGDDEAVLSVDGRRVGANDTWQHVARADLGDVLTPGRHEVRFDVTNEIGLAGLIGRVQWTATDGTRAVVPTNGRWECSTDGGNTWRAAAVVAMPVPAPTADRWAYPHLPVNAVSFHYDLPADLTAARLAVRATGSFRATVDGADVLSGASSGRTIRTELASQSLASAGGRRLTLTLEEIAQPPAAQSVLELTAADGAVTTVPLSAFVTDASGVPAPIAAAYPDKTWPVNVAAFDVAATRPPPDPSVRLEPWAAAMLEGATPLLEIGKVDGSSAEFGDMDRPGTFDAVPRDLTRVPRGLEGKARPSLAVGFRLAAVPANGAALVLHVEDADAVVNTVGAFVNGTLVGTPTVIGYDQVPGRRLTNRAWVVTVDRERLRAGANTLELRLLPGYYRGGAEKAENQAEEYIAALRLRDRKENPYATPNWVHWDAVRLVALARPADDAVNGRPVRLGTQPGYLHLSGRSPWDAHAFRDLAYLGLSHTGAPFRMGVWDPGQLAKLKQRDPASPDGGTVGDYLFATLRRQGLRPYLLFEPGRGAATPGAVAASHEANVVRAFGRYAEVIEVGNEVDHPYFGFDAARMAAAYATIQKQSVVGQMLRDLAPPDARPRLMGQGWYHAWDLGVIDAQQRQESPGDPGFTEDLSAHSYGKSYIIPAVQYALLYGPVAPKPIWVTECGAWTRDDADIDDFDVNLRGNMAYATDVVQYLAWPYNKDMRHFSLFSAAAGDAAVLEKARCFRRLLHAYAVRGRPLAWRYADPSAMAGKLVLVRPVQTEDGAVKLSFVNLSDDAQRADVTITLPAAGEFTATRFGDGPTVAAGTSAVRLTATPTLRLTETLAAGEAVEYLIAP